MAINEFLPFGTSSSANVITQATYAALTARTGGFQSGVAQSDQVNKVWRQATFVASMIGQFASEQAARDMLDNGDRDAAKATFIAALVNVIAGQIAAGNFATIPALNGEASARATADGNEATIRAQADAAEAAARQAADENEVSIRYAQDQALLKNFDYYMARGTTTIGTMRQTYTPGPNFAVTNTLDFTLLRGSKLFVAAHINLGNASSIQPAGCFTNLALDGGYLTGESTTGPTSTSTAISAAQGSHRLTYSYTTPGVAGQYAAVAQILSYMAVED